MSISYFFPGKTFSPEIYAVSAIVLLPINSAFNPLLYSDLPDFIWRTVFANTKFGRWVKQKQIIKASHRRSTLNTYSGEWVAKNDFFVQLPSPQFKLLGDNIRIEFPTGNSITD